MRFDAFCVDASESGAVIEMPIMQSREKEWKEFPHKVLYIPLRLNERAKKNHQQTLEELKRRGGLSASEAAAILMDKGWREIKGISYLEALPVLRNAAVHPSSIT